MTNVLIYPPLSDPTSPYHSTSYLAGYAKAAGFAVEVIDANVEAVSWGLSSTALGEITAASSKRLPAVKDPWGARARAAARCLQPDQVLDAASAIRDESRFFDYNTYRKSVDNLTGWLWAWSSLGVPGQFAGSFGLNLAAVGNLNNLDLLLDPILLERILAPVMGYMESELLPRLARTRPTLVGLSITYAAQLPFALAMASRIRRTCGPDMLLVAGGTEVSDVWKFIRRRQDFFRIFEDFDACVVGEGESAFTSLLADAAAGSAPRPAPNVVRHPKYTLGVLEELKIGYTTLSETPTPDYSQFPYDKYLAPYPYIYYSPSRGCYWNKCTFCDYGLNFGSPTSPWRQDKADKTIEDLQVLSGQFKFIYFSVDVLAPARLLQIAREIVDRNIDIRWGAEIRLEEYWDDDKCATLYASGARAVSVGFESGNQRVLDLINKGVAARGVPDTLRCFHDAGIGVQMMGFTGFPTETEAEALESASVLEATRKWWTLAGLGEFVLTPGSEVARKPQKFGISEVQAGDDDDITRELQFKLKDDPATWLPQPDSAAVVAAKAKLSRRDWRRPWLGGIDTPHTLFYHDKFGVDVAKVLDARPLVTGGKPLALNGSVLPCTGSDDEFVRSDGTTLRIPARLSDCLRGFSVPRAPRADEVHRPVIRDLLQLALDHRLLVVHPGLNGEED